MKFITTHSPSLARVITTLVGVFAFNLADTVASHAAQITLQQPTATFSQPGFEIGKSIDGITTIGNGWSIQDESLVEDKTISQTAVYETSSDINFVEGGILLTFTMDLGFTDPGYTLGHFGLSVTKDDRSLFADGLSSGGDVTANWIPLLFKSVSATNGVVLSIESNDQDTLEHHGGDHGIHCAASVITSIYTITAFSPISDITGFRLGTFDDDNPDIPGGGPGLAPDGNFVLRELQVNATFVPEPSSIFGLAAMIALGISATLKPGLSHSKKQF